MTFLFGAHYVIMIFILKASFLVAMLTNVILLVGIFLGNKFQVMGITGGIATGKSTVSSMLEASGFTIIDADKISKEVSEDPTTIREIRRKFGDEVFDDDILNRERLGDIVFKSRAKRKVLNGIMQGKILWRMFTTFLRLRFKEKKDAIVLDVPLLFETKILEWICFPILVVNTENEDLVKKRLMIRNKLTEEQALDRIRAQMPLKLK
jgi:dephospho-CoA kinase